MGEKIWTPTRPAGAKGGLAAALIAVIGFWLLNHPYEGVIGDGLLYAAQAISTLSPTAYSNDFFFKFGSQNDYTIFSPLYAFVIQHIGLANAGMVMVGLGHLLWLSGIGHLVIRLFKDDLTRITALILVAAGVQTYGGNLGFTYGEGFATARIFAEVFALHGIAWLFSKKYTFSALALILSTALHPLVGLPAIGLAAIFLALQFPKLWLAFLGGGLAVLAMAFAQIAPFDRLLSQMQGTWFAVVSGRNMNVFMLNWLTRDWFMLGANLFLVGLVAALDETRRKLWLAIIFLTIAGVLTTIIGADLLHNVLVIQLQTWRVRWLLTIAQHLTLAWLIISFYRADSRPLHLILLLGIGMLWSIFTWGHVIVIGAVILIAVRLKTPKFRLPRFVELAIIVVAALSVILFLAARGYAASNGLSEYLAGNSVLKLHYADFVCLGLILTGLTHSWRPQSLVWIVASCALVVAGLTIWDRRTDEHKLIEAASGQPNPFTAVLNDGEQVYWRRGLYQTWLLLQHPSFMTFQQGAGVLFAEGSALEYAKRATIVAPMDNRPFLRGFVEDAKERQAVLAIKPVDQNDLQNICRQPVHPDAVVLDIAFDGLWAARWALPVRIDIADEAPSTPPEAYYLYRCDTIPS